MKWEDVKDDPKKRHAFYVFLQQRIAGLTDLFADRLDGERTAQVIDYVQHNENGLALEVLADFLIEDDIPISKIEMADILAIAGIMKLDVDEPRYKFLAKQIRVPGG
ncbi:hypothetical protein ABI_42280 [Asticcacaulis biprosthecium C19]|uniref:MafI family immunity protein n=1 Tax=Asticcacaulis biprosthecium C19 TaxID=715226 RepID=F4QST5_9CAUL|nr:MafI family immunity protein [Asticcacaulis biprosthecium]EGF89805.1 hypothetical protein ABI_42280 [Asticcacaulis biprosthecium C19]